MVVGSGTRARGKRFVQSLIHKIPRITDPKSLKYCYFSSGSKEWINVRIIIRLKTFKETSNQQTDHRSRTETPLDRRPAVRLRLRLQNRQSVSQRCLQNENNRTSAVRQDNQKSKWKHNWTDDRRRGVWTTNQKIIKNKISRGSIFAWDTLRINMKIKKKKTKQHSSSCLLCTVSHFISFECQCWRTSLSGRDSTIRG